MNKVLLPFYGEVNIEDIKDKDSIDFEAEIKNEKIPITIYLQNSDNIELELDFESELKERLEIVAKRLNELEEIISVGYKGVWDDYKERGEGTELYLKHYLENEKYQEEIKKLLKNTDKTKSREEQVLSQLFVHNIMIHPFELDHFFTLDFNLPMDIIHYLLVVPITLEKFVYDIFMES